MAVARLYDDWTKTIKRIVPVLGDVLRSAVVVSDLQSDTNYYKDLHSMILTNFFFVKKCCMRLSFSVAF